MRLLDLYCGKVTATFSNLGALLFFRYATALPFANTIRRAFVVGSKRLFLALSLTRKQPPYDRWF